jgi:peptidyl-prolyl cis-trans isomerase C
MSETNGGGARKGVLAHHLMRASLARYQKRFDELNMEERNAVKIDAAKSFEVETLVLESPEAASVVVPQASLDQTLLEVKERYGDEDEFVQDMARNSLTEDSLRSALERELKVDAVLEKVAASAEAISDEEVRTWYDRNPDKFGLPETRQARHVLITINDDFPENKREPARARLQEVRNSWDGTLDGFSELAQQNSECPSALEGGTIGRVPKGKLYKEVDEVLFALSEGELSQIVESEAGFHLVYCEQIFAPEFVSFSQAAPKIRDAMVKKRRQRVQSTWLSNLMKQAAATPKADD